MLLPIHIHHLIHVTFGFKLFLLEIFLKILIIMILNDIVATLQFLFIKVCQVTEKQFSTQFQ